MANEEHLAILRQGVDVWNRWRLDNVDIEPDLANAELAHANLLGMDFRRASMVEADLTEANMRWTRLNGADLSRADLTGANLYEADFSRASSIIGRAVPLDYAFRGARLIDAKVTGAKISGADFSDTILSGANFDRASIGLTNMTEAELTRTSFVSAFMGPHGIRKCRLARRYRTGHDKSPVSIEYRH